MKPRKRHLTAQIKPATKHALMAQLALAADEIESQRRIAEFMAADLILLRKRDYMQGWEAGCKAAKEIWIPRPWWRRLLGLR